MGMLVLRLWRGGLLQFNTIVNGFTIAIHDETAGLVENVNDDALFATLDFDGNTMNVGGDFDLNDGFGDMGEDVMERVGRHKRGP